MNAIYSWNTTKTEVGYAFTVSKVTPRLTADANGRFADTEFVKTGNTFASRDIAKRTAQKWVRYFNAAEKKAA